jgi:hypothetical protein
MIRTLAALLIVVAVAACSGLTPDPPRPTSPSPTASVSDDSAPVVDQTRIEAALRRLTPGLVLEPHAAADNLGVLPPLSFQNTGDQGRVPGIGLVLVFPSAAKRQEMQPRFGPTSIQGLAGTEIWDGPTHSEWVPAQNVLVEVILAGGPIGSVTPWTDSDTFLGDVREALSAL